VRVVSVRQFSVRLDITTIFSMARVWVTASSALLDTNAPRARKIGVLSALKDTTARGALCLVHIHVRQGHTEAIKQGSKMSPSALSVQLATIVQRQAPHQRPLQQATTSQIRAQQILRPSTSVHQGSTALTREWSTTKAIPVQLAITVQQGAPRPLSNPAQVAPSRIVMTYTIHSTAPLAQEVSGARQHPRRGAVRSLNAQSTTTAPRAQALPTLASRARLVLTLLTQPQNLLKTAFLVRMDSIARPELGPPPAIQGTIAQREPTARPSILVQRGATAQRLRPRIFKSAWRVW